MFILRYCSIETTPMESFENWEVTKEWDIPTIANAIINLKPDDWQVYSSINGADFEEEVKIFIKHLRNAYKECKSLKTVN